MRAKSQATSIPQTETIQEDIRKPFYVDEIAGLSEFHDSHPRCYANTMADIEHASYAIETIANLQIYFDVERAAFSHGDDANQISPYGAERLHRAVAGLAKYIAQQTHQLGREIAFVHGASKGDK